MRVRIKRIGPFDQLLIDEIDKVLRKCNLFMIKYNHKDALFTCSQAYNLAERIKYKEEKYFQFMRINSTVSSLAALSERMNNMPLKLGD